jgi:hypothetical protein
MYRRSLLFILYTVLAVSEALAAAPDDVVSGQRVWFDGLDTQAQGYASTGAVPSNFSGCTTITSWNSKINGYSATQAIAGTTAPTCNVSTTGIGALFDSNVDALSVAGDIWGANGTTVPTVENFVIASSTNSNNTGFLFDSQVGSGNTSQRISSHFPWAGQFYWDPTCCLANRNVSWTLSTNQLYITDWLASVSLNSKQIIINATNAVMNTNTVGTYTQNAGSFYSLGYGDGTNAHAGIISENIVYNRLLNSAEKRILNNYFSAKWGMSIGTDDRYSGDTSANGLYRYHVGGIGQESDGSVATGTSEGLTITNAGFLGAGRYLLAGLPGLSAAGIMTAYNQGSSATLTAPQQLNGTVTTNLPTGIAWRGNRLWYLNKTDATASSNGVTLTFDAVGKMGISSLVTGDNVALLYRANSSSNFQTVGSAQTYTVGSSPSFTISATLLADGYYTIGKVSMPQPVMTKTVSIENDPINASTNPKNIPGAWVRYKVTLANTGSGATDNNTIVINDPIPSNLDLFVNALSPSTTPVIFENPTVGASTTVISCGLTLVAANISYLDAANAVIATPTPDAQGFDSAVRTIKLSPQGILAAASVANTPPYPSCSFTFRLRIK